MEYSYLEDRYHELGGIKYRDKYICIKNKLLRDSYESSFRYLR